MAEQSRHGRCGRLARMRGGLGIPGWLSPLVVVAIFASDVGAGTPPPPDPPEPPDFVVAKNSAGEKADGWASFMGASRDGNVLTFYSPASDNLFEGMGSRGASYLRDLQTGVTSRPMPWTEGLSWFATLNPSGTIFVYVATQSFPPMIGPFALVSHDIASGTDTILDVGITSEGLTQVAVSDDGQRILFNTEFALDPADTNSTYDIYLRDLGDGSLTLVSDPASGGRWENPEISIDGEWVAYSSFNTAVVLKQVDPGGPEYVFPGSLGFTDSLDYAGEKLIYTRPSGEVAVFDRVAGTHEIVSVDAFGSVNTTCYHGIISGDGRSVAFYCQEALTSHGGFEQTYVRHLDEGWLKLASIDHTGAPGDYGSSPQAFTEDGSALFMNSDAYNLGGPQTIIKIGEAYWDEGDTCAADDTTCDGVDDDCDGQTDEDYESQVTNCGIGACAATGLSVCNAGVESYPCTPGQPAPMDATCDGVDDDCDGQVDEDAGGSSVQVTCEVDGCTSVASGPCGQTPNCAAEGVCIAESGCTDGVDNDADQQIDCDDSDCFDSGACGNSAPTLVSISDQTLTAGEILSLTVSGTDADGDDVSYGVAPLPLPANASLMSETGAFRFAPTLAQVGTYQLEFSATDGRHTTTQAVSINVIAPAPGGPTGITGVLLDAEDANQQIQRPIQGATVRDLGGGQATTTAADGTFTLTGIASGEVNIEFDGSTAGGAIAYGSYRAAIEVEAGTVRTLSQPVFLPYVDATSLVMVDPANPTTLSNVNIEVEVQIPAGAVVDQQGQAYVGELTLSAVPPDFTPGALPETLNPSSVVTIQPMGLVFTTPAPITFPNIDNLPPGAEVDIWSLDHTTGEFFIAGTGRVRTDGTAIETIAGGVQETSWHLPASSGPGGSSDGGGSNGSGSDGPSGPGGPKGPCEKGLASRVDVAEATFAVDLDMPKYAVSGEVVTPGLVYDSGRAFPVPLVAIDAFTIKRFAVPDVISYAYRIGGVTQSYVRYLDTTGISETDDVPFRVVVPVDGTSVATSVVPVDVILTSYYADSNVSTVFPQELVIVNSRDSEFGAGWGWAGLKRVVPTGTDGADRLLVDGNGAFRIFRFNGGQFLSPTGDASRLVDNGDGSLTLLRRDGVETVFDGEGKQDRIVFLDGSTWSYFYDGQDRLSEILDPAGGMTTLDYSNGKLTSVTDPASRETQFEHDPDGNLRRVIFPDLSERTFEYDDRHLMTTETNERGFSKYRKFDSGGRITEVVLEDTSSRSISRSASAGLLGPNEGVNETGPAPMSPPPAALTVTVTDAESRSYTLEFNEFRTPTKLVDSAELTATGQYDNKGNLTRVDQPTGQAWALTYDSDNNIESITDVALGATTSYTYHPQFKTIASITDPLAEETQIAYNALGQVTTITTPLQRQVTATYTPEGNLATVQTGGGVEITFEYDSRGNVEEIRRAAGGLQRVTTLTNDASGFPVNSVDALDRTTAVTRDAVNRMTSVDAPLMPSTTFAYDGVGNRTMVTPPQTPSHVFAYSERDWLSAYAPPPVAPQNSIVSIAREREGQPRIVTLPDGRAIDYAYDDAGRLVTQTLERGSYTNVYDPNSGHLASATSPQGGSTGFEYLGNRVGREIGQHGTVTYSYDQRGRLSALTLDDVQVANCQNGSGAIANYPLNGSFVDTVGGNNAAFVDLLGGGASPMFVPGVEGQGLRFGENTRVDATLPIAGRTEVSVGLWFRRDSVPPTTARAYVGGLIDGLEFYVQRVGSSYEVEADSEVTGDFVVRLEATVPPFSDGQWHHLLVSNGPSTWSLFYDGELLTSASKSNVPFPAESDQAILGGPQDFLPTLDLFTFYDRALPPEDVAKIFATQDPFACEDSVATLRTTTYAYDADGDMVQAGPIAFEREVSTGRLVGHSLGDVTNAIGRNGFGEVTTERTEVVGSPDAAYDVTYIRDPMGRVGGKTETVDGTTTTWDYTYDAAGRLTEVTRDGTLVTEHYTYGPNGNRLNSSSAAGSFIASYDDQDRLKSFGDTQYAYRASGELFEKTHPTQGTTTYDYDELGNLLAVVLPDEAVVAYEIDALNRRVGRTFDGQLTHRWIYQDQLNPIAELDADGNLRSVFVYGSKSHVPEAMEKDGVWYAFVTDQVGSVRLVVNADTGAVVQQIEYDSWGNVLSDNNPGFQPFGFAGGLYDGETKLVRFGARDYDPEVGRWTARDTLLFDGGQSNLYAYVANDPINFYDPTGLRSWSACRQQCFSQVKQDLEECLPPETSDVLSAVGLACAAIGTAPACAYAAAGASGGLGFGTLISAAQCIIECVEGRNDFDHEKPLDCLIAPSNETCGGESIGELARRVAGKNPTAGAARQAQRIERNSRSSIGAAGPTHRAAP